MYTFEQVCELFDEGEDTIRQAIALYFERYGGDSNPPYTDEVVGKLDEFFGLVNQKGNKFLAIGNASQIKTPETQQVEDVLGVKGIALAVAITAAREGRALARLKENVARTAFNVESNRVTSELLDSLDSGATWLEDYCEDATAQSKLLKRLGIIQEESKFNEVLEMAIAKTQSKATRPARATQPQWGQYL